jgi:hypothetical protein
MSWPSASDGTRNQHPQPAHRWDPPTQRRHEDRIQRLHFVGLLALADPVRDAAAEAVRGLRAGGVDVMMITAITPAPPSRSPLNSTCSTKSAC